VHASQVLDAIDALGDTAARLAQEIKGCAREATSCDAVRSTLSAMFGDGQSDRMVAGRLATSTVAVLRQPDWDCRREAVASCDQVARVLSGLFTGGDAALQAGPNAAVAKKLAAAIVAELERNEAQP
jgi:hypothetical protein